MKTPLLFLLVLLGTASAAPLNGHNKRHQHHKRATQTIYSTHTAYTDVNVAVTVTEDSDASINPTVAAGTVPGTVPGTVAGLVGAQTTSGSAVIPGGVLSTLGINIAAALVSGIESNAAGAVSSAAAASKVAGPVAGAASQVASPVAGAASKVSSNIAGAASQVGNNIAGAASKATSKIASKATGVASKIASQATSVASSVATGAASKLPKSIGNINGDLKDFVNPTKKFKDGTIKCSEFPEGQGVIKLPWIGRSNWASVTNPKDGNTSTICQEGWLCSYACQPGMSKTQWPSEQPASGESRGGLLCKNGYLYRTNPKKDYLCEWGSNTNYAVSKLDKVLSLCRTDYPGSENMNIPTRLLKGDKKPMSAIIEDGYYTWRGGKTSSQYYVNNAGVDVDQGCLWGNSSGTVGNWAPVVLGSGYTDGKTWLSIIPNPNNKTPPNYNVKIEAVGKAKLQGDCWYVDGKYSGGPGSESDGCTTAVTGGTANFVFTPRNK